MKHKPLINKDGEVRELMREDFERFRPIAEATPSLLAKIKKGIGERGPQKLPKKVPISIRVSPETAEYFRSTGKGWQGRINEILKEYIAHHK